MNTKQEEPLIIQTEGDGIKLEDLGGYDSYINNNTEMNENKLEDKEWFQQNNKVENEECIQTNDRDCEYKVKVELVEDITEISAGNVLEFSEVKNDNFITANEDKNQIQNSKMEI